ncbi:helix-turn-helix domain-containing protein [Eikenella longinqua]|uniref:helix-turn-helix domain-containing protein n=1 Tax=Eikenella longinqua TaxID=1795827 RepID=UPI0009EF35EB
MLNVEQAAERLFLHPETVRLKARTKEIPAYKKNGKWYFFADELDAYIKSDNNAALQEAAHERSFSCPAKTSSRCTKGKRGEVGTIRSPRQTDSEYAAMLKLTTSSKQRN